MTEVCTFEGCERPIYRRDKDFCPGHRAQKQKGWELRPIRVPRSRIDTRCAIPGCLTPRAGTYCARHKARIKRHGDPNIVIPPAERRIPKGPDHWKWSDEPRYGAVHERVVALYGPAKNYTCPCGKPARDWAYLGPRKPGERKPFGSVEQYGPLCKSCHTRLDLEVIRRADAEAS